LTRNAYNPGDRRDPYILNKNNGLLVVLMQLAEGLLAGIVLALSRIMTFVEKLRSGRIRSPVSDYPYTGKCPLIGGPAAGNRKDITVNQLASYTAPATIHPLPRGSLAVAPTSHTPRAILVPGQDA
jgi:hypothetical protein